MTEPRSAVALQSMSRDSRGDLRDEIEMEKWRRRTRDRSRSRDRRGSSRRSRSGDR
jgi:hypothetical protein